MKILWILLLFGWVVPVLYAGYLRRRLDIALAMLEDERKTRRISNR